MSRYLFIDFDLPENNRLLPPSFTPAPHNDFFFPFFAGKSVVKYAFCCGIYDDAAAGIFVGGGAADVDVESKNDIK